MPIRALALATLILTPPYMAAAAPQSSARKSKPHVEARVTDGEPPPMWSASWFADSTFVKGTLTAMADTIASARLGAHYPQGRAGPSCVEFHGQSYSINPEEYWVFRCDGPEFGGQREDLYYQVAAD